MGIRKNSAFTLQELLVVIAVIAVMMVILVSSARTLKRQSELRDAKNTLLVLSMAVEKYHEIHGKYPFEAKPYLPDATEIGFIRADLIVQLGSNVWENAEPKVETANYQASIETLYRFLQNDPQTAAIIAAIPEKFLTAKNSDGNVISLAGMPLIRVVDPWGMPYRYVYEAGYGIAIVESAGPDGMFARVPASEDNDDEKQKDLDNISY